MNRTLGKSRRGLAHRDFHNVVLFCKKPKMQACPRSAVTNIAFPKSESWQHGVDVRDDVGGGCAAGGILVSIDCPRGGNLDTSVISCTLNAFYGSDCRLTARQKSRRPNLVPWGDRW